MNNDVIETHVLEEDGQTVFVEIIQDYDSPHDPRDDDGLAGKLHIESRDFGHIKEIKNFEVTGDREEDKQALLEIFGEDACILPVYMFSHSGISFSTTPFSCRWDSGQVGWIATNPDRYKEFGCELPSDQKERYEYMENELKDEIKLLDQYAKGEVFGFRKYDIDGEEIDSCWGFFGDDFEENGLYENACISKETKKEFEWEVETKRTPVLVNNEI